MAHFNSYIKPEFIQSGVDIKPEWHTYLNDLLEKVSKYLKFYGKDDPHFEDGREWHIIKYWKNGIQLKRRIDVESIYNSASDWIYIYDDCVPGNPQSDNCVFCIRSYPDECKLELYIPGDWDDRIFSWP